MNWILLSLILNNQYHMTCTKMIRCIHKICTCIVITYYKQEVWKFCIETKHLVTECFLFKSSNIYIYSYVVYSIMNLILMKKNFFFLTEDILCDKCLFFSSFLLDSIIWLLYFLHNAVEKLKKKKELLNCWCLNMRCIKIMKFFQNFSHLYC